MGIPFLPLETATPHDVRAAVQAYYDQTWLDYRVLWLNPTTLVCHFGYSDGTTRGHVGALLRLNAVLAERAAIRPGERVFDAGCGVGGSSLWLAEHCGARIVGATLSGRQARYAAHFAAQRRLAERVHFLRTDYACTAFRDDCFDAVWAIESICHASDKASFYAEAARLLRPGGRLVAAEFVRSRRTLASDEACVFHEWLEGWAMPDLDTAEEHLCALRETGFRAIALDDITEHILPSSRRLYHMARASFGIGVALNQLGIRSNVQHGNQSAARRQYEALERGLWRYCLISATRV